MAKEKFLFADYLDSFKCKCGECRNCCCLGWPVTISYFEYMKLLGADATGELRERLDTAFYVLSDCAPDRYAEIDRDEDGECKLRDKDGMCALQKALGEDALPLVCKMYPRNTRVGNINEGTCAMSCEAVLEKLLESPDKLTFHEGYIDLPTAQNALSDNRAFSEIQRDAIALLEDREFPLFMRLEKLGCFIDSLDFESPDSAERDAENAPAIACEATSGIVMKALKAIEFLSAYSESLGEVGAEALLNVDFASSDERTVTEKYHAAKKRLYRLFPDFDCYLEKIMVNHLFYERFPYLAVGENKKSEYLAFIATYATIKPLAALYMADKTEKADLIDCLARAFRYLEHGDFGTLSNSLLSSLAITEKEQIAELAAL